MSLSSLYPESINQDLSQVDAGLLDNLHNEIISYFLNSYSSNASSNSTSPPNNTTSNSGKNQPAAASSSSNVQKENAKDPFASEETLESVFYLVESIGFRVGIRLAELHGIDKQKFGSSANAAGSSSGPEASLECVKFVCKDFWNLLFRKNIDNLKTNHRGVFVLQDNNFRWLSYLSAPAPAPTAEQLKRAKLASQLREMSHLY